MMKRLFLFALLLLTQYSFAQIPKPQKNTYVNDFAHVLSKDQLNGLNRQIYTIEEAFNIQVAVVLVKTIPSKYTIDKYAVQIGRKWQVGKAHNGIVYVAAIDQHKQHIELDSVVYKRVSTADQVALLDAIKPYFRQSDYYGGLTNLIQQLNEHFAPTPGPAAEPVAQTAAPAKPEERVVWPLFVLLALIIGLVFAIIAFVKMCIRRGGDGYPAGTSFWDRRYYRRSRWGSDHYYHTTNNYYETRSSVSFSRDDDDDDNRPSNWGNWGSSSDDDRDDDNRRNSSSSSSGGSFSNSGGSTSDW